MQTENNRSALIWGLIFLLAGFASIYAFVYLPWRGAMDHEPTIMFSLKGFLFIPVFILLGAVMVAPIKPLPKADPSPGEQTSIPWRAKLFITLFVLAEAGSVACFFWLRSLLQGLGYDV